MRLRVALKKLPPTRGQKKDQRRRREKKNICPSEPRVKRPQNDFGFEKIQSSFHTRSPFDTHVDDDTCKIKTYK